MKPVTSRNTPAHATGRKALSMSLSSITLTLNPGTKIYASPMPVCRCPLCIPAVTEKLGITGADIIRETRNIAAERPTHRQPAGGAAYLADDTPHGQACLIGVALTRLGVPARALTGVFANARIDALLPRLGITASADEILWLVTAQKSQDNQIPWAAAIRDADRAVPSFKPDRAEPTVDDDVRALLATVPWDTINIPALAAALTPPLPAVGKTLVLAGI